MASIFKHGSGRNHNRPVASYNETLQSSSGSSLRSNNENVITFQATIRQVLNDAERDQLTDILGYYHQSRNVYHLVTSLESVLDSPKKRKIVPLLRKVLPKQDRPQFDKYMSQGGKRPRHREKHSKKANFNHIDSGIGSNTATTQSSSGMRQEPDIRSSRRSMHSQYISNANHTRESSQSSSNRSTGFGSVVKRKVKAALLQKSNTHERLKKPDTVPRRRHSIAGNLDIPESRVAAVSTVDSRDKVTPHWPRDTYDDIKVVFINKKTTNDNMGFSIRGGAEHKLGIYVSHVEMGSPADVAGLLLGDQILRVNNTPFLNYTTHEVAAKILSSTKGKLVIYVRSIGQVPDAIVTSDKFSWTDANGRPASPPTFLKNKSTSKRPTGNYLQLMLSDERRVNLTVQPGQRLGLMIRGGKEYGLGIYITGVDPNSASEHAGLQAGDQILEVNNISFRDITHSDAVNVIRSSRMLTMMLRHVGKIPQGAFQRGLAGSDQVTLRHAQSSTSLSLTTLERALTRVMDEVEVSGILIENELNTVRYYVNEYTRKHISVEALVLSLSHLLNTHKKFSLMSTIRQCISAQDLDRFDVLVLQREVDTLRKHAADLTRNENSNNVVEFNQDIPHSHYTKNAQKSSVRSRSVMRKAPASPRSSSVPRSVTLAAPLNHYNHITESANSSNSTDTSLPYTSTPNDSRTQEDFPQHPPIIVSNVNQSPRHKKSLSPIYKEIPSLPSPMKMAPPAKPKRTALGGAQEEVRINDDAIYSKVNKKSIRKSENHINNHSNSSQATTSTGSIGRLYPHKQQVNRVNFGPAVSDSHPIKRTPSPFTKAIEKRASLSKSAVLSQQFSHQSLSPPVFFNPPSADPVNKNAVATAEHQHSRSGAAMSRTPISVTRTEHRNVAATESKYSNDENSFPPPPSCLLDDQDFDSRGKYPVTVDVHTPPSQYNSAFNNTPNRDHAGYMDMTAGAKYSENSTQHTTATNINSFSSTPMVNIQETSPPVSGMHNSNNSNSGIDFGCYQVESDSDVGIEYEDFIDPHQYLKDVEKQKIIIFKVASTLGLSVEGGANTRQPLPRITSIQPGGCAHMCGRIQPGHVIHKVNGVSLAGLEHKEVAKTIAAAFQLRNRDSLELLVSGPHDRSCI